MSQGPTTTIRCPYCRHPYPMTPTQLSVYVGRKMGCMACGKPFEVQQPPLEPDPVAIAAAAVGGFPGGPTADPAFAPGAYGTGAFGTGDPAAAGTYGPAAYAAGSAANGWPTA